MWFGVVTLFPDMLRAALAEGVVARAVRSGILQVELFNPRDKATDRHRTVDDRPYGGGPGMLMKVEPLEKAIVEAREQAPDGTPVIYLSPQGTTMSQKVFRKAIEWPGVILVCGRYEGIDERLIQRQVDFEWSLGDFVLSGGEIAALAAIDAIGRLSPGVLGHDDSATEDSHEAGLLDHPHYTRPDVYEDMPVPEVLKSGDHELIRKWRLQQRLLRTRERRPDLWERYELTGEEKKLLSAASVAEGK